MRMEISISANGRMIHGFKVVDEGLDYIVLNSRDPNTVESFLFNTDTLTLVYFDKFTKQLEKNICVKSVSFTLTKRGVYRYLINFH